MLDVGWQAGPRENPGDADLSPMPGGGDLQARKVSSMNEQNNRRPVLITLQNELEQLQRERDEIAELLAGFKEDLFELQRKLRAQERAKSGDDGKLLSEVKFWLKAARETEKEIEAIRRKEAGIAGEYGLDLEQAGHEIGCRLAGLRACCGAEEVSG
jgi:chromosome segregation ATPase